MSDVLASLLIALFLIGLMGVIFYAAFSSADHDVLDDERKD